MAPLKLPSAQPAQLLLPFGYYKAYHFGERVKDWWNRHIHLGLTTIFCLLRVTKHFKHLPPFPCKASIMSNQQKPAPPGPCNHSEGVSFTPDANFSLQSTKVFNESFCQALLQTWLESVFPGWSWDLGESNICDPEHSTQWKPSPLPLPEPFYLYSASLPRSPTRCLGCESQWILDAQVQSCCHKGALSWLHSSFIYSSVASDKSCK